MLGMTQQVTNMLPVLKPLTFPLLEAVQRTHSGSQTPVTPSLIATSTIWLNIYHDLTSWQPISQPMVRAPLSNCAIGVFPIRDDNCRHIGILSTGPTPFHFLWPNNLQTQVFITPATKLKFPHVYLLTLGLLCAILIHAKDIRNSHFTCFLESVLLESILQKGCDKRCRKTSTLIKAIFVTVSRPLSLHILGVTRFGILGERKIEGAGKLRPRYRTGPYNKASRSLALALDQLAGRLYTSKHTQGQNRLPNQLPGQVDLSNQPAIRAIGVATRAGQLR